ncbi:MAG: hypothetical protein JW804_05145 [Sedimentisphaerales bacterium]|nr:hypothetical protein [Sedimentisphaerales bacterium]
MFKDENLKSQSCPALQSHTFDCRDNLTELLSFIITFTQARQKILIRNINSADKSGFMPQDLPVDEFAQLLDVALDEHIQRKRLLLCDTSSIKFGQNGLFDVKPCPDHCSERILRKGKDKYIELQINKLLENTLNQKFAAETLKQKQIMAN